jgi:hypothetical protein
MKQLVLKTKVSQLGEYSDELPVVLLVLGKVLLKQGSTSQAEGHVIRSLDILRKSIPHYDPSRVEMVPHPTSIKAYRLMSEIQTILSR